MKEFLWFFSDSGIEEELTYHKKTLRWKPCLAERYVLLHFSGSAAER